MFDLNLFDDFRPNEYHFIKFEPYILLSALKLEDIREVLVNARLSLYMYDIKEWGQIKLKSESAKQLMKKKNLLDAVSYYNYVIDLSWQMLFLYSGENSYRLLIDVDLLDKYLKTCNFEILSYQLTLANKKNLLHIVKDFFYDKLTLDLREIYNHIKHRGTYDIDSYRKNRFPIDIGDSLLVKPNRKNLDLEHLRKCLIDFDSKICNYLLTLAQNIFPHGYFTPNLVVSDLLFFLETINKELDILEEPISKYDLDIPDIPEFGKTVRAEIKKGK